MKVAEWEVGGEGGKKPKPSASSSPWKTLLSNILSPAPHTPRRLSSREFSGWEEAGQEEVLSHNVTA